MKCYNPRKSKYTVRGKHYLVPCGECPYCLMRKRAEWFVRLSLDSMFLKSDFLTLTYSDEYCDGVLHRNHLKTFLDEVRKIIGSFEFLACGEYGGETDRPHYHVHILTNVDLELRWKAYNHCWKFGFIRRGSFTLARANYANANHILPKEFRLSYPVPPFNTQSRGIGKIWLENYRPLPSEPFVTLMDGKNYPMPRYIRDKLGFPKSDVFELNMYELWNKFLEDNFSNDTFYTVEQFEVKLRNHFNQLLNQSKKFRKL